MTLDMCDRPLFFTDRGEQRTRGIIVAGLNWVAANGLLDVQDEMRAAPWRPSAFFQIDDPFRTAMTKRFAAWGLGRHPQDVDAGTGLHRDATGRQTDRR